MGFEDPAASDGAEFTSFKSNKKALSDGSVSSASQESPWQPLDLLKAEKKKEEFGGGYEPVQYAVKGSEPAVETGEKKFEYTLSKRTGGSSVARSSVEESADGELKVSALKQSKGEETSASAKRVIPSEGQSGAFMPTAFVGRPSNTESQLGFPIASAEKLKTLQKAESGLALNQERTLVGSPVPTQGGSERTLAPLGERTLAQLSERTLAPLDKMSIQPHESQGSGGSTKDTFSKVGGMGSQTPFELQKGFVVEQSRTAQEIQQQVPVYNKQIQQPQQFQNADAESVITSLREVPQSSLMKAEPVLPAKETANRITPSQDQNWTRKQDVTSIATTNGGTSFSTLTKSGEQIAQPAQSRRVIQGAENGVQSGLAPRDLGQPNSGRKVIAETTPLAELPAKFTKTTLQLAQTEKFTPDAVLRAQADRISITAKARVQENQVTQTFKPQDAQQGIKLKGEITTNSVRQNEQTVPVKAVPQQPGLENGLQPKERVLQPTDRVLQPIDRVLQPGDRVLQPVAHALQPADRVLQPAAHVLQPTDRVLQPKETGIQAGISPLTGKTPQELVAALKPQEKTITTRSFSGESPVLTDRKTADALSVSDQRTTDGAPIAERRSQIADRRTLSSIIKANTDGIATPHTIERGTKMGTAHVISGDIKAFNVDLRGVTGKSSNTGSEVLVGEKKTVAPTQIAALIDNVKEGKSDISRSFEQLMSGAVKSNEDRYVGGEFLLASLIIAAGAARRMPERTGESQNHGTGSADSAQTKRGGKPVVAPPVQNTSATAKTGKGGEAQSESVRHGAAEHSEQVLNKSEQEQQSGGGANSSKPLYRPIWIIAPGETFVSIAEEHFGDGALAWLIADLNAGKFSDSIVEGKRVIEIQARQRIELPVATDIEEFRHNRMRHQDAENIITIVTASQLDIELKEATFKKFLGTLQTNTQNAMPIPAIAALPHLDLVNHPKPARVAPFGMTAPQFASIAAAVSLPLLVPQMEMVQSTIDRITQVQETRAEIAKPEEFV